MPVTAVRDEGALRMWVCRLPVHIGPLGSCEFAENCRKTSISCGRTESSAPTRTSGAGKAPLGLKGPIPKGNYVPDARNADYYAKRPCAAKVESAARIFADYLAGEPDAGE